MMNGRNDPECDYVYKSIKFSWLIRCIVVLSGEMGVGKSNIL